MGNNERNKILVLGNGFDLYHGLPTNYTDFLFLVKEWETFYSKYKQNNKRPDNEKRTPSIRVPVGKLSNELLDDFVSNAWVLNPLRMEELNNIIQTNGWIEYFLMIEYANGTWVDFEREIQHVLEYIEEYYEVIFINSTNMKPNVDPRIMEALQVFAKRYGGNGLSLWFKGTSNSRLNRDMIYTHKLHLLDVMARELDDLQKGLFIYLNEFVMKMPIGLYSEQIKELSHAKVLSFNYTDTFSKVYGRKEDIVHVHGYLENHIVMGIDDNWLDSMDYVEFKKYYQRIVKGTGNSYREWVAANAMQDSEVYIMGHSLDPTDKNVLEVLFASPGVKKIVVFYHSKDSMKKLVKNLVLMFGQDDVIRMTGSGRITFEQLLAGDNNSGGDM